MEIKLDIDMVMVHEAVYQAILAAFAKKLGVHGVHVSFAEANPALVEVFFQPEDDDDEDYDGVVRQYVIPQHILQRIEGLRLPEFSFPLQQTGEAKRV